MKKLFVLLIGTLLVLCGCWKNKSPDMLTIGVTPDYPPFEFKEQAELKGFDIELAELIAHKLGKKAVFKEFDFNQLLGALSSSSVDCAISALTASEERKQNFDFSEIYYSSNFAYIVKKENGIHSTKDLHDKKIGVQIGSTMEAYLKTQIAELNINIITRPLNNPLIQELNVGRIHAVLVEKPQAIAFSAKDPSLSIIHVEPNNAQESGFAVAFPKNSSLKNAVNKILQELKSAGKINELVAKWL